ncbi:hypothetical protein DFJ74DRAFT_683467 [Hyaloraphidium curvatum]|nr:hypothetical protein DFJ74DRAFT_683467 [Hyaloraphidium curvatum]
MQRLARAASLPRQHSCFAALPLFGAAPPRPRPALLPATALALPAARGVSGQATVRKGTSPRLASRKAVISITPTALDRIRSLQQNAESPRFLRIGVKNKGCSGLEYALDYVDKKGKFDEEVKQEDVTILVDSKALFTIIGSEMDYVEDKLSSQFVFTNPNIKETCGCGQSFAV